MRVVAGSAKGRSLIAPPGTATRPTTDRVREAVFNALYSLGDPVVGARVADLFAGSGALGIEALSRGAASATFVDQSRTSVDAIRRNVETTGLAAKAEIICSDVLDWLRRPPGRYDLLLCDPPYEFGDWSALLAALEPVLVSGLAVLESDRELPLGEGWEAIRSRRYGSTVVSIVRRRETA